MPKDKTKAKADAAGDGGKKKPPIILFIIIGVVVIGAAAAAYFLFFRGEPKEEPEVYSYYSPGDFFVTNVSDDSTRLFKTSVVLVLNTEDAKLQERLDADNVMIRDTIIFILRDVTVEEIMASGNKDDLRQEILSTLNKRLGIDNIKEVLFNDFVMS